MCEILEIWLEEDAEVIPLKLFHFLAKLPLQHSKVEGMFTPTEASKAAFVEATVWKGCEKLG